MRDSRAGCAGRRRAAEVASSHTSLRACQAQLAQTEADAASRAETSRLTELSANSGFQSPANAALARASAAQGSGSAAQQRAQCEIAIGDAFVALITHNAMSMPSMIGLIMLMGVLKHRHGYTHATPQPASA